MPTTREKGAGGLFVGIGADPQTRQWFCWCICSSCPLCCCLANGTAGTARLLCLKLFRGSAFPARLPGLAALRFSCTLPT